MDAWYITLVLNKCPHCRQGDLFTGVFQMADKCSHCGALYERWPGSWTGPTVIGYGLGAATAAILAVILHSTGNLVKHSEWGIIAVSVLVVIATFRFVKAGWIGLMYDWGYIYPDPE